MTKDSNSIRSTRSARTTHSNQSTTKETRVKEDTIAESDDDKSEDSTIQITNKSKGNKEKWTEIKKKLTTLIVIHTALIFQMQYQKQ